MEADVTGHLAPAGAEHHSADQPLLPSGVGPELAEAKPQKARSLLIGPIVRQPKASEGLGFIASAREDCVDGVRGQRNELEAIGLDWRDYHSVQSNGSRVVTPRYNSLL